MTPFKYIIYTLLAKRGFYIPEGMTVTGSINSDVSGQITGIINGDVVVNGRLIIFNDAVINGNVLVNGPLVILNNAAINGNVNAQNLEIWGRVTGYIQCSGKTILGKASFVKGNIRTAEIHIEKDSVLEGIVIKPETYTTEENIEQPANIDDIAINRTEPFINRKEDQGKQNWF